MTTFLLLDLQQPLSVHWKHLPQIQYLLLYSKIRAAWQYLLAVGDCLRLVRNHCLKSTREINSNTLWTALHLKAFLWTWTEAVCFWMGMSKSIFWLKIWPGSKYFQLDTRRGYYHISWRQDTSWSHLLCLLIYFCKAWKSGTKELLLRAPKLSFQTTQDYK